MANRKVQVIQVPYDSGNRSMRMGRGPEHFINNNLAGILESDGHKVFVESIEPETEFRAEIQTQFELYGLLAECVQKALEEDKFPLILSGNCGATLGAIAGAKSKKLGVIWFDAHGDFNTPETTESGFLDGMGLAIATGICWKRMAASIPNFTPINGANILHIGGRAFDTEEQMMFEQEGVAVVDAASILRNDIKDALQAAMLKLRLSVEEIHLHVDLDVLDPKETPANGYVTKDDGLNVETVVEAIVFIKENLKITSATIAAFDPQYDRKDKTLQAGMKIIKAIVSDHNYKSQKVNLTQKN